MLGPPVAGRHPLTELLSEGRFIPNNTRLGAPAATTGAEQQQLLLQEQIGAAGGGAQGAQGRGPRVLLITGPNASGKSVYMKQVRGNKEEGMLSGEGQHMAL